MCGPRPIIPIPDFPLTCQRPRVEDYEPPFDPSAFWRYPDWDGPLKEPFWMRPLKFPAQALPPIENYL